MRSSRALLPLLLLAGCTAPQGGSPALAPAPEPTLHAETFGATRSNVRTLIIVLHADGAADHYRFAQAAAREVPDSVAVALLRPGYSDTTGKSSPGDRGTGTGDNYTPDRVAIVADSIVTLRRRYPGARTLIVGDSGGAAIAANLAGVRPDLVDGIVLVGCPCTLPEWRSYMKKQAPAGGWDSDVTSLDPLKTAGGILPGLRAAVLVGADDKVTPVKFSRAYAEALTLRGIATDYRIVPNRGHALLDDPEVLAATRRMAAALPVKG